MRQMTRGIVQSGGRERDEETLSEESGVVSPGNSAETAGGAVGIDSAGV